MITFVFMGVNERIRMIIESHGLTAGAFADRIGVQRSNVSHVLSGRNKPGFEFLEKIVQAFPKVQAHWLLTGKQTPSAEQVVIKKTEPVVTVAPSVTIKQEEKGKKVVKIVTFYDDFTFDTHTPNVQ